MSLPSSDQNLVYIDEYGLLGSNYHWQKRKELGITDAELKKIGVSDARVRVSKEIVPALQAADAMLKKHGFRLYVKDGYRSKALYALVYEKRTKKFGRQDTETLMNMQDKPHASGKSVDVTLWDPQQNKEMEMRNKDEGIKAIFVDFYKNKTDHKSERYQKLQELLIETMLKCGFRIGKKREFFHFNYQPDLPQNYPLAPQVYKSDP